MSVRKTHCPYLGLRQNREVRFSTPSTEHRCYASGEAMQIPVDQSSYCLSQFHTQCPLYMGSVIAPKDDDERATIIPKSSSVRRSKEMQQNPRDSQRNTPSRRQTAPQPRISPTVYGLLLGVLLVAVVVYIYAGNQLATGDSNTSLQLPTVAPTFEPLPTAEPTADAAALIVVNTATSAPTDIPVVPTATVEIIVATATPEGVIDATATLESVTATPDSKEMPLQLYFADSSGRLLVPVQRNVTVVSKRVAGAALGALIAGPQNGLMGVLMSDVQVNSLSIQDNTALVDVDRRPTNVGDVRGFNAIALTLTQFDSIKKVKFYINGGEMPAEPGIPSERPLINVWNPDGLTIADATVLTLYFVSTDGRHDIPLSKVINKTNDIATAHIQGLIAGPGPYADILKQSVPAGTQLLNIRIDGDMVILDLSAAFADAPDRAGAMRTIVESLTSIASIKQVQVLVEGESLATRWGAEFAGPFSRRVINPE